MKKLSQLLLGIGALAMVFALSYMFWQIHWSGAVLFIGFVLTILGIVLYGEYGDD